METNDRRDEVIQFIWRRVPGLGVADIAMCVDAMTAWIEIQMLEDRVNDDST
jgi:hypothetical protein